MTDEEFSRLMIEWIYAILKGEPKHVIDYIRGSDFIDNDFYM